MDRARASGGERAAIGAIDALVRDRLREPAPGETFVGDDAAVVTVPGGDDRGAPTGSGRLLLAADAVVEGVHFDLSWSTLEDVGWKAIAVNVSDVAAMGGRPLHALVTVVLPQTEDLGALYRGLVDAASAYGCAIVGGDLSGGPAIVVSVAVTGVADAPAPVLRSGARPGDALFVTGPLGRAAAGLALLRAGARNAGAGEGPSHPLVSAHLRPQARVAEGLAAAAAGATAMIDVSDGFGLDLDRLARASGVGVIVDRVPVAEGASPAEALGGGEDYELLFAAPSPERVALAFAAAGLGAPAQVGSCVADPAVRRCGDDLSLPDAGYEHPVRWTQA